MTWWFRLLMLLALAGAAWLAFKMYLNRREMALKQKVLESESQILKLENEKLEIEVDSKTTELMSKAVQMAHKNEILIGFKDQIEEARTATDVEKRTY